MQASGEGLWAPTAQTVPPARQGAVRNPPPRPGVSATLRPTGAAPPGLPVSPARGARGRLSARQGPRSVAPRPGPAAGSPCRAAAGRSPGRRSLFRRKVRRNSRRHSPRRAARTRVTAAGRGRREGSGGELAAASPPPRAVPCSAPAVPAATGPAPRCRRCAATAPGPRPGTPPPPPSPRAGLPRGLLAAPAPPRRGPRRCPERRPPPPSAPVHASSVPRTARAPPARLKDLHPAAGSAGDGPECGAARGEGSTGEAGHGRGARSPVRHSPRRTASPALCTPETAAPPPGAGGGAGRGGGRSREWQREGDGGRGRAASNEGWGPGVLAGADRGEVRRGWRGWPEAGRARPRRQGSSDRLPWGLGLAAGSCEARTGR